MAKAQTSIATYLRLVSPSDVNALEGDVTEHSTTVRVVNNCAEEIRSLHA